MQLEVVDRYLCWELSKPFIRTMILNTNPSQDRIRRIIQNVYGCIEENVLTFNEKLDLVMYFSPQSNRANLFKECSWIKKDVPVRDLGTVLPVCGDLPLDVITRSLSDVIKYARERLNAPNREKSIKYIADLMKIPSILKEFPIIVIEPCIRQRNIRVMEGHYGPGRRWNISPTSGYIEDGNHRAIAMAIVNNLESILCHVGKK